jgi:PAS domain S-box-containing protein
MADEAILEKVIEVLGAVGTGRAAETALAVEELRRCSCTDPRIKELTERTVALAEQIAASNELLTSLASGRLDQEPPGGAPLLAPSKQVQANLRHLLWQLDRIAAGDYSQKNEFLGDFTSAYEALCSSLRQKKELEERLRSSEEYFRSVVTTSPDAICMTTPDGTIVFASSAGMRIFELDSLGNAIGRSILDFIVPEAHGKVKRDLAAMANGPIGVGEYPATTLAGKRFWIGVNGDVMRDAEGRPEKFLFVIRDITWRKEMEIQLEESERSHRTLVEAAAIPIFILAPDTKVEFMNDLARRFLKLDGEGPWYFRDFLDVSQPELIQMFTTSKNEVVEREAPLRDTQGRSIWGHISARTFDFHGSTSLFVSCSDMTERKRTEEQLALATRKLTLLGSITRHDVMNHLTALNGFLELANMRNTDPNIRRYLEKAIQSSAAIQRQMELTKTYQSVGTMEAEWIDLRPAIEKELAGMDLGKIKVDLAIDDIEVLADPMFVSCIHNLVTNSLKHGELVHNIRIYERTDLTGLIITVEDDGKGIPPTQKQAIFDWNYSGRTGHGLHFVKEVLSSTGMRIRETGAEGTGARFEIIVPPCSYKIRTAEGHGPQAEKDEIG